MAVDAYLIINGRPGPSTTTPDAIAPLSNSSGTQTPTQPTTVQVGEQSMAHVASRLGVSHDQLLQANPQIKDPLNLKAGQEIQLPANSAPPASRAARPKPRTTIITTIPNCPTLRSDPRSKRA